MGSSGFWEIDEVLVTGYPIPGSDATLSDLQVDGVTLTNFDAATTSYKVELPAGTSTVPTVSYTTNDASATVVLTDATDLAGDNAARTTTVVVTAQDGVTTITYNIQFNPVLAVTSIADLRSGDQSRVFMITSEVLLSYKNASRNQKYIQDATGGVMIDDPSGIITTTYEIGDILTGLKGKLAVFGGLLEFLPLTDPGAAVSSGNEVVAEVITIEQLNAGLAVYESKFVRIKGISFPTAGANFESKVNINFTDGVNTAVLRTNYSDLDYIGTVIPNMADIAGVVIQYNGTAQLVPRFATDIMAYSSDASLSDLQVNATTIDGFVPGTLDYNVMLPVGTTDLPVITYTAADVNALAVVTNATDLNGDEAARTATIEVTAEDGTQLTYTIVFTVDNTGLRNITAGTISIFPVPAVNNIIVKGLANIQSFDIINILGSRVKSVKVTSDEMTVNISDLDAGIYMIRTSEFAVRFVKK